MGFFRRSTGRASPFSLDEFLGEESEGRSPSPLELSRWEERLAAVTKKPSSPKDLALPAFSLIRGGDLFERPRASRQPTDGKLLESYRSGQIRLRPNGAAAGERELAVQGLLRVLRGNPAVCRRMLLAKPITVVILPAGDDFRRHGFPPSTNPRAAGLFWNSTASETALLGLREELISEKPYLMVHEMAHAVHLMGFTTRERELIDEMLLPVYRSRRWIEEVVAIYAERAFGAEYEPAELMGEGLYAKTRREWTDRAVFSLFVEELLRP